MIEFELFDQLKNLQSNIEYCDESEVKDGIHKLSSQKQQQLQEAITLLNSLLIDGSF